MRLEVFMKKVLTLKVCENCGATVQVEKDCKCKGCGISCCGKPMKEIKANSVDCAVEKHKPCYEIVGNEIVVSVNHVMEENHLIEYVYLLSKNKTIKVSFNANETAKVVLPYIKGSKIYAYCNKHGLWETEVL